MNPTTIALGSVLVLIAGMILLKIWVGKVLHDKDKRQHVAKVASKQADGD